MKRTQARIALAGRHVRARARNTRARIQGLARRTGRDAAFLLSAASLVVGVAMVSLAAGLIAAGLVGISITMLAVRGSS